MSILNPFFQNLAVGAPRSVVGPFTGDFHCVLHNTQPGHYKFYEIILDGTTLVTRWGRIGATNPQSKTQTFPTREAALSEANATYREKTSPRKGYVHYTGDTPGGGATTVPSAPGTKRPAEHDAGAQHYGGMVAPRPPPQPETLDFSVMLAESWDGDFSKVAGWWWSEKMDGVRAIWKNGRFWTRSGNQIKVPSELAASMPQGITLDGELWRAYGNANFNAVNALVRSLNPAPDLWHGVQYLVFDAPEIPGPLSRRLEAVPDHMGSFARKLQQHVITSETELWANYNRLKASGAEGLMLRDPNAPYEHKRSKRMLKMKQFEETEATVMGYNWFSPSTRSSLLCRLDVKDSSTEFSVTVSAAVRENPPPIGSLITVKFFEKTASGVPRFPSYKGLRYDLPHSVSPPQPRRQNHEVIDLTDE